VPQLQRIAASQVVPQINHEPAIAALRQQVQELSAQQVPAQTVDVASLTGQLDALDQRMNAFDAALGEQREKSQMTTGGAGLAFVRLENRLLRGAPFAAELGLLEQLLPNNITVEQERDLTAAAAGVLPAEDLADQLRLQERQVRRAERVALADNPLDRAWAEVRSLVLIRDTTNESKKDDAFEVLVTAIRRGDAPATATAWQALSDTTRQMLSATYSEVERRQRAEKALTELAPVALAAH
jgi:hypothetical protein